MWASSESHAEEITGDFIYSQIYIICIPQLHQIRASQNELSHCSDRTPESRCLLNNLVKDHWVKGWGWGKEDQGHPAGREVVRHDLLKSGTAKPQGHPLVLWPIGAGRPTINLLCTLNPFNTHRDPDEEISSLREGHITLLALRIHRQPL